MKITSYKDKKSGRTLYEFRAYMGIDPVTGKQKQVRRRGFETKKDAQLAYIKLTNQAESKRDVQNLTYQDVYDEWMEEYKMRVRESTFRLHLMRFQNHILPKLGSLKIHKIDRTLCQKLIVEWNELFSKVSEIKKSANMVFLHAIKNGVIEKSPFDFVTIPKKQEVKEFENYLDREELKALLDVLKKDATPLWYTFFFLIAMTGLRRAEALALEWKDVDFEHKTIRVNKTLSKALDGLVVSPPKTLSSERVIAISDDVARVLGDYKANSKNNRIIFYNTKGGYITLSQPTRRLNTIIKNNNLKHITPHGLRHTHCCLLFEAGASIAQVQQRLGHSDSKMTLEVYNHVTKNKEKEVPTLFENYLKLG